MSDITGNKTLSLTEHDRKLAMRALDGEAKRLRQRAEDSGDDDIAEALRVQADAAERLRDRVAEQPVKRGASPKPTAVVETRDISGGTSQDLPAREV